MYPCFRGTRETCSVAQVADMMMMKAWCSFRCLLLFSRFMNFVSDGRRGKHLVEFATPGGIRTARTVKCTAD